MLCEAVRDGNEAVGYDDIDAPRVANCVISADADNVVLAVSDRDNVPLIVLAEEPLRVPRALADALDKAETIAVLEREGPEVTIPLSVIHIVD